MTPSTDPSVSVPLSRIHWLLAAAVAILCDVAVDCGMHEQVFYTQGVDVRGRSDQPWLPPHGYAGHKKPDMSLG